MKESKNTLKIKEREEEEKQKLIRRLNIIAGQVSGLQQMVLNDRYCADILVQISSTTNALKSLGSEILKNHMKSCMVKEIQKGNFSTIDEILDLVNRLK